MHYSGRAIVNPDYPEPIGICDRCGNMWQLRELRQQWQYVGTGMQNLHGRICPDCLDIPSPFLRAIVLPPDPPSILDPRIENYAVDERNALDLTAPIGSPSMFLASSSMSAILTKA